MTPREAVTQIWTEFLHCGELDGDLEKDAVEVINAAIATATAELQAKLAAAEQREAALRAALPPTHRLKLLAMWIDMKYPDDPNPEVQRDLRKWAKAIELANGQLTEG